MTYIEAEQEVLGEWKKELSSLDELIALMERRLIRAGKIVPLGFEKMAITDAAINLLRKLGPPARETTDIMDALMSGGASVNYGVVYESLRRLEKRGNIVRYDGRWGLAEWTRTLCGKMSTDDFAESLTRIVEHKLASLPPEEQDKRIEAFEQKVQEIAEGKAEQISNSEQEA